MDGMTIALLVAGLGLLVLGAELLVRGASRLAAFVGVSQLVIGLTVVSYGTSTPELAVSLQAGLAGNADITAANVVGSNIYNILAIAGICGILTRGPQRRSFPDQLRHRGYAGRSRGMSARLFHGLQHRALGRLAISGVLCRLHGLSHHGCNGARRLAGFQPSHVDVRPAAAGGNGVRYYLQVAETTAMKDQPCA
jgi:hypothetical protein